MKPKLITIVVALVALVPTLVACAMLPQTGAPPNQPTPLPTVEVREYQGEKLGSIADFYENSIKGPQHIDPAAYRLEVTGLVSKPTSYSYSEAISRQHYSKVVTLHCVEGWDVKILWEGIRLADLLAEADVDSTANTVIFYAHDGYSTSLPLDYILSNDILLADKMNGLTLPPERGFPFQLVAEDKWGYKWIKWVTKIELSSDDQYRGYWEQRGFNNEGTYGEDMFE